MIAHQSKNSNPRGFVVAVVSQDWLLFKPTSLTIQFLPGGLAGFCSSSIVICGVCVCVTIIKPALKVVLVVFRVEKIIERLTIKLYLS